MAGGDGQVVFTVEMDDTAFRVGLANLETALLALSQNVLAAFTPGEAQWQEGYEAGSRWMSRFAAGLRAGNAAATTLRSVVSGAVNAARATGRSGGTSIGQNIVSGMIGGVNAKSGALNAALQTIVLSALAAARRAAGIRSPSALFRDEVGRYLALGVQDGFTGAMAQSVLPAIAQSVGRSAAAGRQALDDTLLSRVQSAMDVNVSLPDTTRLSASALAGSAAYPAASAAAGGDSVYNVTQNITFESAMQAPDEVARAVRRQATYGLAAARG